MNAVVDSQGIAPLRVAVVTDVCLYHEGLARLLSGRENVVIVGTSSADPDTVAIAQLQPEVVLVDAATVRATDVAHVVMDANPNVKVVAFAVAEEDDEEVIACVESGAVGFVARNATVEEPLAVIQSAARGEVRCSPRIAALVFRRVAKAGRAALGAPRRRAVDDT